MDVELHNLARRVSIGSTIIVLQRQAATSKVGEINDRVSTLSGSKVKRLLRIIEVNRTVEQSSIGPDLPESRTCSSTFRINQAHLEEATIRCIQKTEAIAS